MKNNILKKWILFLSIISIMLALEKNVYASCVNTVVVCLKTEKNKESLENSTGGEQGIYQKTEKIYGCLEQASISTTQNGRWVKDSVGWWYRYSNGSYPKNQFKSIDGKIYYFGTNGYMVTGWKVIGQKYYYFYADGHMAVNTTIDGYQVDETGAMIEKRDRWVKDSVGWWYRYGNGSYPKNQFKSIDGKIYYFGSDGYMAVGWNEIRDEDYYFYADGHMAVDEIIDGCYLNEDGVCEPQSEQNHYEKNVYGMSEQGRELCCYIFNSQNYTRTVLMNFEIHGYEDYYARDGQVLVDTANKLIDYYNKNPEKTMGVRLIVIPSSNPDGLQEGFSNNGFGRCNAKGIDLNRDFDANYISQKNERNYTPYAFSAAESRALRDLVNNTEPEVVIDFHGWLNYTIGDYELAQVFEEEMGLSHYKGFTTTNAPGYFANWGHQQGAYGLLVEFKDDQSISMDLLQNAINRIIARDYVTANLDPEFTRFKTIKCYTTKKDRVNTYKYYDKPYGNPSYVDGVTDEVTILEIYDNGWTKIQYPINGGSKSAYIQTEKLFFNNDNLEKINIQSNTYVYKREDLTERYGNIYKNDECYVVNKNGNVAQIIYPIGDGEWKMGWCML